jgi:Xaa-Pro aminopeptidase
MWRCGYGHEWLATVNSIKAGSWCPRCAINNTAETNAKWVIEDLRAHAISHFLGLDVHDAGDYERPLEENMVLTVEPGIYLPAERIGVRIEDDVLITKTGARWLSK